MVVCFCTSFQTKRRTHVEFVVFTFFQFLYFVFCILDSWTTSCRRTERQQRMPRTRQASRRERRVEPCGILTGSNRRQTVAIETHKGEIRISANVKLGLPTTRVGQRPVPLAVKRHPEHVDSCRERIEHFGISTSASRRVQRDRLGAPRRPTVARQCASVIHVDLTACVICPRKLATGQVERGRHSRRVNSKKTGKCDIFRVELRCDWN